MTAEIVPLTEAHIAELWGWFSPADVHEIAAMSALPIADAVRLSLRVSLEAYAGLVDGVPVCAFGLGIGDRLGGVARPWLLTTAAIKQRHQLAFLRRNRAMVARWAGRWRVLENYVSADNKRAIKWLTWLGFTIHPAAPYGPFGHPFHRFDMIQNQGDS